MPLLTVALVLALVAFAIILWVRWRSSGEETGRLVLRVSWIGATFASALLVVGFIAAYDAILDLLPQPRSSGWQLFVYLGLVIGATMYLVVRVLLFDVTAALQRWSCRLPAEHETTIAHRLVVQMWFLGGFVGATTLMAVLGFLTYRFGLPMWLFLPLMASILPIYQTFVMPWVQYLRAPKLSSRDNSDVEEWLHKVSIDRGLPRIRVRVQEGRLANAFATGGVGSHLVVIGGRLLDRLTRAEVRAVLAHELAHVERRHVPRRVLPLMLAASSLYVGCVIYIVHPLFDREQVLFLLLGTILAGVFAAGFFAVLPGIFMRRMEFEADRLAVETLGDGRPLADALTKLCELNGRSLDAGSWSHPPMRARLEAIHALQSHADVDEWQRGHEAGRDSDRPGCSSPTG